MSPPHAHSRPIAVKGRSQRANKPRATAGRNAKRASGGAHTAPNLAVSGRDARKRGALGARFSNPRLRTLARRSAKLGLCAALAYGLLFASREVWAYATTSPRFELRTLRFEPTPHLDDGAVRQLLALPPGSNILAADPEQLAERVAASPWVASATVLRHLPDTLEVRVVERRAVAVLHAGGFYLVDEDGQPFKPVAEGERGDLPILTGIERAGLDEVRSASRSKVRAALELIELYEDKRRPRLSEVHFEGDDTLSLYTAEAGTRLRIGRNDREAALARYDALRLALGPRAEGLAVVHLDDEPAPGASTRVVARFVDMRDELALVSARQAELRAHEIGALDEGSAHPGSTESSGASPAKNPNERRMPRYD